MVANGDASGFQKFYILKVCLKNEDLEMMAMYLFF